jgi:hypothetical protein
MPDNTTNQTTDHQPELLTITEAAALLRAQSPPSATGGTSAPVRTASGSAAASCTAVTNSSSGSISGAPLPKAHQP